jgi:phosphatidylserine decarboxylase
MVESLDYREGSFEHAASDKAFENNERMIIDIDGGGVKVRVMQIAGMIARRVVCRLEVGQELYRGEKIGIIRFGSRLEVFVPANKAIATVKTGERVICGETPIAKLR